MEGLGLFGLFLNKLFCSFIGGDKDGMVNDCLNMLCNWFCSKEYQIIMNNV